MPDPIQPGRISVVIPSMNQGQFIEATIRSVIEQDYPHVECIVIDGGSRDGSVDTIRRYEKRLAYWVSESDHGQADAINKGWRRATGDILAYLNSDDTYEPGILRHVAVTFQRHPDRGSLYGNCRVIDAAGRVRGVRQLPEMSLDRILCWNPPLLQPAVFWRKSTIETVGELDPTLHYTMDYDLFLRVARMTSMVQLDQFVANMRKHPAAKTSASPRAHLAEARQVAARFLDRHADLAPLRSKMEAAFLLREAHVCCLTGESRRARALCGEAVRLDPFLRSDMIGVWLKSLLPLKWANLMRRLVKGQA